MNANTEKILQHAARQMCLLDSQPDERIPAVHAALSHDLALHAQEAGMAVDEYALIWNASNALRASWPPCPGLILSAEDQARVVAKAKEWNKPGGYVEAACAKEAQATEAYLRGECPHCGVVSN